MNPRARPSALRPSTVVVPAVIAAVLGAAAGLIWGLTVPGVRGMVTKSGDVLVRQSQLDHFFVATAAFVGVSLVGGVLTAFLAFRGTLRSPAGVGITLGAAALGVLVAVLLGQAVVNARFAGPGGPGIDYIAAPTIRLDGANFWAPADHSAGRLGELYSWILVLVWPGAAMFWCLLLAAAGRVDEPAASAAGAPPQ